MSTEQKLRLLEYAQEISATNKKLLEISTELEDNAIDVFRAIDNLLKAATHINNAVKN